MNIKNNVIELIGNTPMVYLNKLGEDCVAKVALKLEGYNPAGSVKDRVALNIVENAEKLNLIEPKVSTLIEPTSGNTGIGLAMVCAIKGYRLILTMPASMSIERRKLLTFLGAEIVLTDAQKGMTGAIEKAQELQAQIPNSIIAGQFENPANPQIHYQTTAREIWNDTDGKVDMIVAGVGTGGTLSGIAKYLKEQKSSVLAVAVEPDNSAVLSGQKAGMHKIQGIGAGFIPKNCDVSLIDWVFRAEDEKAIEYAKLLAKKEGILSGISGGAAVYAALALAKLPENKDKLIVAIIPDSAEKYLSTSLFALRIALKIFFSSFGLITSFL